MQLAGTLFLGEYDESRSDRFSAGSIAGYHRFGQVSQRRSTYRHSRAGGNPAALGSRLRGNDGMLFPDANDGFTPGSVVERRWRWESKVRKRFPTQDQFLTPRANAS